MRAVRIDTITLTEGVHYVIADERDRIRMASRRRRAAARSLD